MKDSQPAARYSVPIVTFVLGCLLSAVLSWLLFQSLEAQLVSKFEGDTEQIVSLVQNRMNTYTNALYGAQGLFSASDSVTEEEWVAYVEALDMDKNYRGISSMLYVERIPRDDADAFPYEIYPFTDKADYYPITYVVQQIPTATGVNGFDLSSETKRATALRQAAITGDPTASAVVPAANTNIPVFSIYQALYEDGARELSGEARLEGVRGYVGAAFRVKELFEGLASDPVFNKDIDAQIYDAGSVEEISPSTLLFDTNKGDVSVTETDALHRTVMVPISGRIWTIEFTGLSTYSLGIFSSLLPWIVLVSGIGLSALLALTLLSLVTSRTRAISIAKQMTASLAGEKAKAEAILGSLTEGVAVADRKGNLIYWNPAADEIIGVPLSSLGQQEWTGAYGIFYPDEKTPMPGEKQALALALAGETVENFPEFVRNQGHPEGRHIAVSARPVILPDGSMLGAVCIFRDTTKEFEIDRSKSEFVSLASHQLRTPLTSIKWYAELLAGVAKEGTEEADYANEIAEASTRMNNLVGALLDVSRLDLGTFIIDSKPDDVLAIMQSAVKEQQESFKNKRQTLTFSHPDSVPKIPVDQKLLFIIVQNFISNAHKYSPEGGTVTLTLHITSDGAYEISCVDTGYGIPKTQQANIFKKLFRADNIRTLDVEGTGLGLYMVKTIADAADCELTFVSEEGKGTTFTFTIPPTGMRAKVGTKTLGE